MTPLRIGVLGLALAASRGAGAADCGASAYACALAHVEKQQFAEAIPYLERQLASAPRDLKALNLLGIALTGAGRKDAANDRFRRALAVDPRFYPALKNLAINEYDAGRLDEARRHLEQALELVPRDEIANLYLGEIHYAAKRTREALAHYEQSGERYTQDPRFTLHYARVLLDAARTKQALAVLERLPAGAGPSLFEAGVALGQAGAHAEAARFFGAARASGTEAATRPATTRC